MLEKCDHVWCIIIKWPCIDNMIHHVMVCLCRPALSTYTYHNSEEYAILINYTSQLWCVQQYNISYIQRSTSSLDGWHCIVKLFEIKVQTQQKYFAPLGFNPKTSGFWDHTLPLRYTSETNSQTCSFAVNCRKYHSI